MAITTGWSKLKILFTAAEVAPFAKTGGLADVAGALPMALAAMGHDVRIVLPRYKTVQGELTTLTDFPVEMGDRLETALLRKSVLYAADGEKKREVPVYLIDNYQYFYRDHIYGYRDEGERFAFFCKALLEMLPIINFQPDIIHCNDWQTGPVPLLLKEYAQTRAFFRKPAAIYTIHNLQYQGNFDRSVLTPLGIGPEYFRPEGIEFYNQVSYTKSGLVYADRITTVSRRYAEEIQTVEYGEKLDGLLRARAGELTGIINGIDTVVYDPAHDPVIASLYGPENPAGKRPNKQALQKEMGLPLRDVPLIGLVSRLVDQKGLDLIEAVLDKLLTRDLQFVILGSGESHYEDMFRQARKRYPEKVGVAIGFNGTLAQRVYAGADLFLMPSRFEPCGLGQLIALRYGAVPIVRLTGGLADTVQEFDPDTGQGNGFCFTELTPAAMLAAIDRALTVLTEDAERWQKLMTAAMSADYSWAVPAKAYVDIYRRALRQAASKTERPF